MVDLCPVFFIVQMMMTSLNGYSQNRLYSNYLEIYTYHDSLISTESKYAFSDVLIDKEFSSIVFTSDKKSHHYNVLDIYEKNEVPNFVLYDSRT